MLFLFFQATILFSWRKTEHGRGVSARYRQMSILRKRKRDASSLRKAKLRGEIRDEELKRVVGLQPARMGRGNELPVFSRSFSVPISWKVAFDSNNVVHMNTA